MELPQSFIHLKRAELQKLCKQLGLRANGKNVAMVRSLEEYRDKLEQEEERVSYGQEEGEKKVEEKEEEEEREPEVLIEETGEDILTISDAECSTLNGKRRGRKTAKARKGRTTRGGERGQRRRKRKMAEEEVTPLPAEAIHPSTPGKMEHVTEEARGRKEEQGRKGGEGERGGEQGVEGRGGGSVEAVTSQEDDTAVSMDTDELGTSGFKGAKINTRGSKHMTETKKIVQFENKLQGSGPNIQQEEPPNVIPNSSDDISSDVHDMPSEASNDILVLSPTEQEQEELERETILSSMTEVRDPQPLTISSFPEKKRRRDTYSLSPHLLSASKSLFGTTGNPKERRRDTFSLSPPARNTFDLTSHSPPPSFLLSSGDSLLDKENDSKRKRDTFSVFPAGSSATLNRASLSNAGKGRPRRHTHSVSPNSSILAGGRNLVDTISAEKVMGDGGVTEVYVRSSPAESSSNVSSAEQIMALLDKRVQERKADRGYIPPPSLLNKDESLKHTHIPIPLSKMTAKFNKSHQKSFKKMLSIVDYAEQKKRRLDVHKKLSTPGPPAKRQKVAPRTPVSSSSSAKPRAAYLKTVTKTAAHKRKTSTIQCMTDQKPQAKGSTIVKPVVRREPNTHFSGSTDVLKPFQFTASPVTGVKEADSSALKKREEEGKSYKPHKGRLPKFVFPLF